MTKMVRENNIIPQRSYYVLVITEAYFSFPFTVDVMAAITGKNGSNLIKAPYRVNASGQGKRVNIVASFVDLQNFNLNFRHET